MIEHLICLNELFFELVSLPPTADISGVQLYSIYYVLVHEDKFYSHPSDVTNENDLQLDIHNHGKRKTHFTNENYRTSNLHFI
ncbi:hypothetical protein FKM82_023596 [Ascaphus truei]